MYIQPISREEHVRCLEAFIVITYTRYSLRYATAMLFKPSLCRTVIDALTISHDCWKWFLVPSTHNEFPIRLLTHLDPPLLLILNH